MAERLRRPTMNDVAGLAGVSLKSVSRVINDEVGASPETRDAVREITIGPEREALWRK